MSLMFPSHVKLVDTFLFLFLLSGGIIENPKYRKYESLYSFFITMVTIIEMLGCSVGFTNASEVAHRVEILIQVSAHVYFLSLHWIVKWHKKSLIICANHLRGQIDHHTSKEAADLTEMLFKRIIVVISSIFILFLSLIAFTSIFIPLVTDFDFKDKYIYVMPFWFTCTDSGVNYFPVKFLCWNIDTYTKYFVMNSTEILLFQLEVFVYITSFIFYACVQAHTKAHLMVIEKKIAAMSKEMEKYCDNRESSDKKSVSKKRLESVQDDIVCEEFVHVLKYHQFIFKVEDNIIPFLCWIVSASLSVFCAISTFSAFIVVTEAKSDKKGEMMFRMKIASVIANAGVMFFLYCHGAEVTMHINEDIADTIYDTPWYFQSIRFKKLVVSFMTQIQRPLQISAFGMYKLNLNFFMSVCRTIYQALNMLLMAFTVHHLHEIPNKMEGVLLQKFTRVFLLTAGISRNPKNKLWETLYSFFITTIYVIEMNGNYVGYKSFDLNVEEVVEMIFRIIGHTYVFLLYWFIKFNKESVLKITSALLPDNYTNWENHEVTKLTENSFKHIGRMTLSVYYASMLTYMLMSIFVGILTNLKAAEVYIYLFPYWYSCPADHEGLFCWNAEGYKSYLLKNGSQFGLMFVEQLALFNGVSLLLLLILNFEARRTVLEKHLRNLSQKSDSAIASYWNSWINDQKALQIKARHDATFHRNLVDFIRYHQKLRSVVVDAKPVLTGLLSLVLCFIWLLMLFTLCFIMVEESGSFIHRMKVGSLVIMTVLVFYLTCYLGELLSGLNYSFIQFLYDTPWYNLSGKSRKIFIIQLLLLQRSYRLKVFGMFFINMERFAFSLRTMYTVLNILLISLKKK